MIEMFREIVPLYGSYAGVGLAGAWLAYRARRRAAELDKALKEGTFTRTAQVIVRRVY